MDPGEAAAVALALQTPNSILIIDDMQVRQAAIRFRIRHIGTIGLVIQAKSIGAISSARPILEALLASGFYAKTQLIEELLSKIGEGHPGDSA